MIAKKINNYIEYSAENKKIKNFYGYLKKNKIKFKLVENDSLLYKYQNYLSKKQKYDYLHSHIEYVNFFITIFELKYKIQSKIVI